MTQDLAWIEWTGTLGWLLIVMGWLFWRLEEPGLHRGKGALTWSRTVRRWLGIVPAARRAVWAVPAFVLVFGAFAAGAIWVIIHIVVR